MRTCVAKKVHEGKQKLSLLDVWGNESRTMPQLMIAMSNGEKKYKIGGIILNIDFYLARFDPSLLSLADN
jgi:hypothetical protein